MERYKLKSLYSNANELKSELLTAVNSNPMLMGLSATNYTELVGFIAMSIYAYYYDDFVAYYGEDADEVTDILQTRMFYDILIKMPYWYKKYETIKSLLTTSNTSLMQSSKMTSSSNDTTKSAGGTLQKTATTPTGVSATGSTDSIDIDIKSGTSDGDNDIETNGFADKYTNAQQKFANATRVEGSRSGNILREGSVEELLKVLEELPSSFADEITKALQKHFIFAYELEDGCCMFERTSRKEIIGQFSTSSFAKASGDNFYSLKDIPLEKFINNSDMLVITWGNAFVLCPIPVMGAGHSVGVLIDNTYISRVVRVKYELKDDNTKLDIALDSSFTPVSGYTGYIINYKL